VLAIILVWNAIMSTSETSGPSHGCWVHAADDGDAYQVGTNTPNSVAEARGRAHLLHETIHGALQVMHRDLFREDEKLTIPSRSLEDVFRELARSHRVEVRWLAVNTEAMNVDHKARTDFEKNAVKALASGKTEFESAEGSVYRRAGVIRLSSQCLKCHLPIRTSTKDRAAGLVIAMPFSERK
jgi:hypothetical protein